ncbi:HdeA/HdeB family chaperone [Methylocella sp.]|uniref:HdeA/HdeB family chaperone n=1 Tax=Methylocella sp. TaxID=1978226 RepID=UPI003783FD6E
MKIKIAAAVAMMTLGAASAARAQVMVDMSLITCKQLVESPEERMPFITAWMAGYFGAKENRSTIDLRYLARNIKVATEYCRSHGSETVMQAVEKTAK